MTEEQINQIYRLAASRREKNPNQPWEVVPLGNGKVSINNKVYDLSEWQDPSKRITNYDSLNEYLWSMLNGPNPQMQFTPYHNPSEYALNYHNSAQQSIDQYHPQIPFTPYYAPPPDSTSWEQMMRNTDQVTFGTPIQK